MAPSIENPCRMLKMSASFVLASLRGSTYPTRRTRCLGSLGWAGEKSYASAQDTARLTNSAARTNVVLLIRRTVRLAAAALNGHFEHPAAVFCCCAARPHSSRTHIAPSKLSNTHKALPDPVSIIWSAARPVSIGPGGCGFSHSYGTIPTLPIAKNHFSLRKTSWLPLVSMA